MSPDNSWWLSGDVQVECGQADRDILVSIDGRGDGAPLRHHFLEHPTGLSRDRVGERLAEWHGLSLTAGILVGELSGRDARGLPELNRQRQIIADLSAVTTAEEAAPSQRERQETDASPECPASTAGKA